MHKISRRTALGGLASVSATVGAGSALAFPGASGVDKLATPPRAVSESLLRLIQSHREASEEEVASINPNDEVWCKQNGVPHTQEADDRYHAAVDAADRALRRIVHFRCHTAADRACKAEYLMERVGGWGTGTLGIDEDYGLYALLRAMREEARAGA